MSNPIRSRIPAFAAVLTVASLGAACSSSAGTSDTTTASSASPTTDAVATVPTPTSTTSVASTDTTTVEEAIRAAHTRVMTEMYNRDERVEGPEAMLPLAEELTTGPLLQRIKDSVAERVASGERVFSPGFDSHITKVTVLSTASARVLDCAFDRSELYGADGSLLTPADEAPVLVETEMVLVDGKWLAQEINAGGAVQCDPST